MTERLGDSGTPTKRVVVVDGGLGNVSSVRNMVHRIGVRAELRTTPDGLSPDDRYILPGVGSFDSGVARLRSSGWFDFLQGLPSSTPVLGICLGMQLLGQRSEEGRESGLGRLPVHFERFRGVARVPHMGWNLVETAADPIFDPTLPEFRYYFTHSYRAVAPDPSVVVGATPYGASFPSVCRVGATYGVQFHPEKSHRFGMSLLRRWMETSC